MTRIIDLTRVHASLAKLDALAQRFPWLVRDGGFQDSANLTGWITILHELEKDKETEEENG